MTWKPEYADRGNEARKCKYDIVRYTRGKVLDLGSGPWKPFPHFIGIDDRTEWPTLPWNPDIIMDATNLSIFATNSIDAVFSAFLLDQLDDPKKVLKEWWRVIKPGGHLVLYLPHKDYYPHKGEEGCNQLHQWEFGQDDIIGLMSGISGEYNIRVMDDRANDDEYAFLQIYQKNEGKGYAIPFKNAKKKAIVLRYGGIGDSIQASSILPQLKEQGYHVTFLTQSDGHEILKHDPHIDEFFLVDRGQVPMEELGSFWANLRKKYDKFVNLTETVEVGLLPVPGMTAHKWPKSVRHSRYNFNYLEFTHMVAELPYKPNPRFYPTQNEIAWVIRQKKKHGEGKYITWAVGSSIHKVCPYMDQIIARILLTYPDIKVVLVGEELDRILDTGWEDEPRVLKRAGKWNVRQSLTFSLYSDLVIGAETGILNAISHESVPKVITLSHSSIENLTRDWIDCTSITPDDCECYPCHQLNTTFNECPRHEETGVAMCQGKMSPEKIWYAIKKYLGD